MKAITTLGQWFKENPNIAAEWDSEANTHLDTEIDGFAVNQKAWWICDKGHHYDMLVFSRTLDGQGCPYCKGKRTLAGFNDLATTKPDVLWKWDYEKNTDISPTELTESSHRLVWWKCEKGHSWQARVQSVTAIKTESSGCPYCDGKRATKGENDLATCFPEIAAQWCYEMNDTTPDEVKFKSERKVWWKCDKGHTWEASISSRTKNNSTSCPYCINYRVWPGFNDLQTLCPEIASEWNYERNGDLKPTDVLKTSRRHNVWWKCREGHEWQTIVYARTKKNGTNCPICSRRRSPR